MSVENRRPFATTTTFHGVPYVSATKNRCGQAFWIAALAVAFAVAIFSVVQVAAHIVFYL